MDLIRQVALVSEIDAVGLDELTRVSAALQKQVTRDLAPIWSVRATVDAFARLEDVPLGYWPIIVVQDVPEGAGVHLDKDGQPYALVEYGPSWSLTASHECLEMLVDPFGDRLVAGPSVKNGQGRVEYLVEVCDPSESEAFAYTTNGVLVSDFYTPHFFDPVGSNGTRYSFGGHIQRPRQVLKDGYLSWHEPVTDHWWQMIWFGTDKATFVDLGTFDPADPRSVREIIDAVRPETRRLSHAVAAPGPRVRALLGDEASNAKAEHWRDQIKRRSRGAAT
jgi:hypothetical protein